MSTKYNVQYTKRQVVSIAGLEHRLHVEPTRTFDSRTPRFKLPTTNRTKRDPITGKPLNQVYSVDEYGAIHYH